MVSFKKNIYFNWRLITLQYCSGFCLTLTRISHGCTCVRMCILNPPPTSLPIPSLRVVPVQRLWVPCFMHRTWTGDLFQYGNTHVSVLFSQIIPPLPSPTESKRLFYTSVSLLLSHIHGYCYHLSIFHIYVSILYWCFSFWLTSLCIIGSSFIHLIRTDSNVFFLMAE